MGCLYVCAACRARQGVLRRSAVAIHPQRLRRLSERDLQPVQFFASASPRGAPNAGSQLRTYAQQQVPIGRYSRQPLESQQVPVGRYSRQPLEPRQLLDRLSHDHGRTPDQSTAGSPNPVRPSPRRISATVSRSRSNPKSTSAANASFKAFQDATWAKPGARLDDWSALEHLLEFGRLNVSSAGGRGQLPFDFAKKCFNWMKHVGDRWVRSMRFEEHSSRALRPSEALRAVAAACHPHCRTTYPSMLWRLSSGLLEQQATKDASDAQSRAASITELMTTWNLIMRLATSVPLAKAVQERTLDWTHLPDATEFGQMLQQQRRPDGNNRISFESALNLLVTPFISRQKRNTDQPISDAPFVSASEGVSTSTTNHPSETLKEESSPAASQEAPRVVSHFEPFDYPSAALVTLHLLHDLERQPDGTRIIAPSTPWISLMETIFKDSGDYSVPTGLQHKLDTPEKRQTYEPVIQRFMRHQPNITTDSPSLKSETDPSVSQSTDSAVLRTEISPEESSFDVKPPTPQASSEQLVLDPFLELCSSRLGRARERNDIHAAERVYREVQAFRGSRPQTRIPIEMYEHFLFAFQALRHGDNITNVWNDMIKAGHKPTTKTYTIMMKGNQTMRDLDTMQAFWEMMRQAGLQPDHHAWSTKIFGLLKSKKSHHLKLGMAALEQMGHEWVTAATQAYHGKPKRGSSRGSQTPTGVARVDRRELLTRFPEEDLNGVPRPNAVIMNAAIMALAASRDSLIAQALQWGRSFGIEPDLKTYNALINVSMRHGSADEAMNILQKMKERGIQADSTTMTVMTSAMFEGGIFDGLDAEEVGERVVSLMREVDQFSAGGMDEKGYALIMDRLLKLYNNHAAAQQVLEHMLARGLKPNAEIYTIIMTSYFQQSPPNFAAVESLWSRIRSENSGYGALLDNTFYDRMIELSAQHHTVIGTKLMLSFVEAMEKDGKRPSWRALEAAARALDEAGEQDRLALLVDRAKRLREDVPDSKQAYGVRAFWDFIASTHVGASIA